jgi:streptogrisin D
LAGGGAGAAAGAAAPDAGFAAASAGFAASAGLAAAVGAAGAAAGAAGFAAAAGAAVADTCALDVDRSSDGLANGEPPLALQALTNRMARKATDIKTRIDTLLDESRPA